MIIFNEYGKTHNISTSRKSDYPTLGEWKEVSLTFGTMRTNYPNGCQWNLHSRYSSSSWDFTHYSTAVAAAFFVLQVRTGL